MRQHKVMLGEKVLYQAAQLSHAQRFASARQAESVACHVVPDTTPDSPERCGLIDSLENRIKNQKNRGHWRRDKHSGYRNDQSL